MTMCRGDSARLQRWWRSTRDTSQTTMGIVIQNRTSGLERDVSCGCAALGSGHWNPRLILGQWSGLIVLAIREDGDAGGSDTQADHDSVPCYDAEEGDSDGDGVRALVEDGVGDMTRSRGARDEAALKESHDEVECGWR